MAQEKRFETFMAHFSDEISPALKDFVINNALVYSRYLFVKRVTSTMQRGFCTHCQKDYMVNGAIKPSHNGGWKCQKCGSLVVVKHAGRGRGKLLDEAYVIWYEKSLIDPGAITATGYRVSMDYRDDFKGETTYYPVTRYVFEKGKAVMMYRNNYSGMYNYGVNKYENGWSFAKKPWSMIGKHSYTGNSQQSVESIHKAIKGTHIAYGQWSVFADRNMDLIYFFSKFAKYPFIEYLWKMGMYDIVQAMVEERNLYRAINLRGKTPEKILGLSKKELKEWKAAQMTLDPLTLYNYKWFRRNGAAISWQLADKCQQLLQGSHYRNMLSFFREHLTLPEIISYIEKQMKKDSKRNYSVTGTLSIWKDYIEECQELGMDIAVEKVLMPNNLQEAHQKTMRQIKIKRDETLNRKIEARQKTLKKYWFENHEFLIRPAASSIEMFDEGKALDHCVGRYADRYAKGEIIIMFIRKVSEPGKPFYTLELHGNKIVQCRGRKNCDTTPEVKTFNEAFKNARLSKKIRANKKEGIAV